MLELPVTFRAEARDDLAEIFDYVLAASDDAAVAGRLVRRIVDRCARIGRLPFAGRAREDIEPGLRLTTFERSIVIAYRVGQERVEITNIFGRGRDFGGALLRAAPRRR